MSGRMKRSEYHSELKKKKLDRLLNVLIAIVSILIVIKLFFVLTENDKETAKNQNEKKDEVVQQEEEKEVDEIQESNSENSSEQSENSNITNEVNNKANSGENVTLDGKEKEDKVIVTKVENDEYVEEIIVNENWKPIPTKQTGPHISVYKEGDIDYEEKLEAIRSAVNIEKDNIIYWSVKNNGSPDTSISIISTKDQKEKYRVSIEWIENKGWKPVKVEKLKKLDGLVKK